MFERFTERSRRVVVLAQEEARMLDHNYIGTEHILLGLIHEKDGVAARAIASLGLTLQSARDQVREIIGAGAQTPSGHIPFTPRAKKVLELSLREALALRKEYIGTEHILLGLMRESEGVGAQILDRTAPLATIREKVIELATAEAEQEEPLAAEWLSRQAGVVRLSPRAVASVRAEVVSEFRETLATIGGTLEALEQRLAGIERRLGMAPNETAEAAQDAGEAAAAAEEATAAGETATAADEPAAEEAEPAAREAEPAADQTPEESAE
jgi:Clp amino terminal domain, pathogenicity island component